MSKKFPGLYLKPDKITLPPPYGCVDATYRAYMSQLALNYLEQEVLVPSKSSIPAHTILTASSGFLKYPSAQNWENRALTNKDLLNEMNRVSQFYLKQMEVRDISTLLEYFFSSQKLWNLDDKGNFHKRKFAILCDPKRYIPLAFLDDNSDVRVLAQFIYETEQE